jgi:hypothetical protein
MSKRIKHRVGNRWLRLVEIFGWSALAGGLAFIMFSLDAAIRAEDDAGGNPVRLLTGCAIFCFGCAITAGAKQSGTRWRCSQRGEEQRLTDAGACVGCQTTAALPDGSSAVSGRVAVRY